MARVTVEDCLENVENRFELVMVASKRARQLATGGKEPLVKEDSDKATVIALREIAENLLTEEILNGRSIEDESAAIFGDADTEIETGQESTEAQVAPEVETTDDTEEKPTTSET